MPWTELRKSGVSVFLGSLVLTQEMHLLSSPLYILESSACWVGQHSRFWMMLLVLMICCSTLSNLCNLICLFIRYTLTASSEHRFLFMYSFEAALCFVFLDLCHRNADVLFFFSLLHFYSQNILCLTSDTWKKPEELIVPLLKSHHM